MRTAITMTFDSQAATETVAQVAREHAAAVDATASFPTATVDAARDAGLLALTTATSHGGHGGSMRDAGAVIERVARECGSSAMVLTMHFAGNAVLEAYGSDDVRKDVAAGKHLSTLAFSEAGSRSHFWAPVSTAKADGDAVTLDAKKSWITSASHATAYVWSSKPTAAAEASTLWLVPRDAAGLKISGPFDGLGLRGNDSAPVHANAVSIPAGNRLGEDGAGFGIMMQTVLPTFSMLISAGALGLAESLVQKSCEHVAGTNYEHLPEQSALRDLPTIRAYVARMRIQVDMAKALWQSTFDAIEQGARGRAAARARDQGRRGRHRRTGRRHRHARLRRHGVPQGGRRRAHVPRHARVAGHGSDERPALRLRRQGDHRPAVVLIQLCRIRENSR